MNIDDVIKNEVVGGVNDENVSRETFEEKQKKDFGIFSTPSLDKPIQDYFNHPLNKSNDEDLAQGLRGIDAFVGNTNLAIIDLIGFIKYFMKKVPKKKVVEDA